MTRPHQTLPKKVVLCAVMLILLNQPSTFSQQRWSIGPRVGANISNLLSDENNDWLPGWSVGGFIMYSDINHFGVSGDILFSQKGAKFENVPSGTSRATYTHRINYLEIPVLARYFLTLKGSFRPNFFIGPSVALRLNAKTKEYSINNTEQPDADITDFYRPADLGFVGGVALNFEVAKGKRVLMDARYTYGLIDITVVQGRVRNSAITLNLSYGFGVGKKYGR